MDFKTLVKIELTKQNKTQTWLAEQLGVSQPAIAKLLSKNDLRVSQMEDIARALGGRLVVDLISNEELEMKKQYDVERYEVVVPYKNRGVLESGYALVNGPCEHIGYLENFDNREDALEALKKYEPTLEERRTHRGTEFVLTEYAVEEVELDEDGDPSGSVGLIDTLEVTFKVINDDTDEVIGEFRSYRDAEKAMKAYEDEHEDDALGMCIRCDL